MAAPSRFPIMTSDLVLKYNRVTVTVFGKKDWSPAAKADMLDKAATIADRRISYAADNYVEVPVVIMAPGVVLTRDYFFKRQLWTHK